MPAYKYEALTADGRAKSGLLEAENARAARAQLRSQSLVPVDVQVVTGDARVAANASILVKRGAFSRTEQTVWTRQLAGLVGSGLPLERALSVLTEEAQTLKQREMLANLKAEVNGGNTFARALAYHPRDFDDVYRAVVAAGEQSGALGPVLDKLADDMEEQHALRAKVFGAVLYPVIVSIIALIIVIFLLTYVVPQVTNVFVNSKRALPVVTVAMLAISAFVRQWGWLVALMVAGGFVALRIALQRSVSFRESFDAAWLRLPLIGRLARGYNAARFTGTLSMLAGSGVPILKALQAASETLGNRAMRKDAMEALVQVREGATLASAMAAKRRFPGLISMFSRLGEQTGTLPLMLQRAASQLSAEVQRRAMAMATIMEPLLVVVMGAVVLFIVLAVMLPIIQLNSWVK
jgi:general secretion pathway protein F